MTPTQTESITANVLRQLDAVHPNGMKASSLLTGCHEDDLRFVDQAGLNSLLSDLQEQGFVGLKSSETTPELKRYVRTVKARTWLHDNQL